MCPLAEIILVETEVEIRSNIVEKFKQIFHNIWIKKISEEFNTNLETVKIKIIKNITRDITVGRVRQF